LSVLHQKKTPIFLLAVSKLLSIYLRGYVC
jgi:hypothetical protein